MGENKDIYFEFDERFQLKKILYEKYNGLIQLKRLRLFENSFFDSIVCKEDTNHDNLNEFFNLISEKSSKKHFNLFALYFSQTIETIEEFSFKDISFDSVVIHGCMKLNKIHKNCFGENAIKIKDFWILNLPNIISEKHSDYDINCLFMGLINCEQIRTIPFETVFEGVRLKNLKEFQIYGLNSLNKIEIIEKDAFYECEQIQVIQFYDNNIKLIKKDALRLKSKSDKTLKIVFKNNSLTNASFENNWFPNNHPIVLCFYEPRIKFLDE